MTKFEINLESQENGDMVFHMKTWVNPESTEEEIETCLAVERRFRNDLNEFAKFEVPPQESQSENG